MGPTQNPDYHTNPDLYYSDTQPHQVTTTHEGIDKTNNYPQLDLHTPINALATLANLSITMTPKNSYTSV